MKTAQEVFDIVVTHARAQGCKALYSGFCNYLTEDGKKCFVGALIPAEIYSKDIEGLSVRSIILGGVGTDLIRDAIRLKDLSELETAEFYEKLQTIHDSKPVENWEEQFEKFAKEFNLVVTPK